MQWKVRLSLTALLFLIAGSLLAGEDYDHFLIGNGADVVTRTTGLLVMQGGGTDVDENYVRMGAAAGGGDFVVIRATGGDAYNSYIFELCSCDSVETLVIKSRNAASNAFIIEKIRNAEALWIAGGDQSNYVRFWKGTPVEDAIHHVVSKPAPIGGTSAGMAIMGEFSYGAMSQSSLTSEEGLTNPYHEDVTLERDFLLFPKMKGILTDQHLQERDRIGRTVTFLARLVKDGWTNEAKAIAADRETALHVNPVDGTAEVFTTSKHPTPYVYFLRIAKPPEICEPDRPLTYREITLYRIGPGGKFDLDTWSGSGGIAYTLTAEKGVLSSSRGEIY
jgi:cyanophycinase